MSKKTLDVFYKGRQVGTLAETGDKRYAFQYSDEWLGTGFSISPFSLPLKKDVFVPEIRNCYNGLFGVFADSLPDAWGELLLDRVLQSKGIEKDSVSVFDRLAYVGNSGMGALEYYPSKHIDFNVNGLDYDSIAAECERVLSSKTTERLDMLFGLGGSSGGTRPKILVREDGEDWIIKFPSSHDKKNSGRMEYDYYLCARKSGIIMTESHLIPSKTCDGYFKTMRFDRDNNEKIFSISFAGLLEADFRAPSCDYETYMKLVNVLTREDKKQIEQMYRIMCFNIFTHNLDDHTKNFSFLWKNDKWELAPAYDLTYSDTYYGEHTTSVKGKGRDILDEDLVYIGVKAKLTAKRCKEIIEEIKNNTRGLSKYLGKNMTDKIGKIGLNEKLDELMEKD